jgi:hypothetical protein
MYVHNRAHNYSVRRLTKKEIILMAKELGMMHVLYAARKNFWELQNTMKLFGKPTEYYLLEPLKTKEQFFKIMDIWERRYKIDKTALIRYIQNPL